MTILVVIIHVFVCLFLIAVILLQAGRGQGLSWGVFGGTPQSILGTKTATFLSRVTTICASIFLVTCIGLNIIETRKSRSLFAPTGASSQIDLNQIKKALEEAQKTEPTTPPTAPTPSAEQAAEKVLNEVQATSEVPAGTVVPVPVSAEEKKS